MAKKLKTLINQNPDILAPTPKTEKRKTRHFALTTVAEDDPVTMVVCGVLNPEVVKHNLKGVTCEGCLAVLDALAGVETYEDALAVAKSKLPNIVTPDPDVMEERHGDQPTRRAAKHQRAFAYLKGRLAQSPADLPARMVGGQPKTLIKNLYEHGLIDEAGDPSGVSAADLANGNRQQEPELTE